MAKQTTDKHKREGFHMVRIPADLYSKLAILAKEDSRTTNAYIVLKLKQLTTEEK